MIKYEASSIEDLIVFNGPAGRSRSPSKACYP